MKRVNKLRIECTISIIDGNMKKNAKSVNPDNNPKEGKGPQEISCLIENGIITYKLKKFEKISTLRLTVEDLLNHISFSNEITNKLG
jgi:hypothetical protein